MNSEDRPIPEELLEAIKRDEKSHHKGRLKIFLGMAAGVGKTFSMLEEAQKLLRQGVDVVVGIVETHGRHETEELLKGLPKIPQKVLKYRDKDFYELDLDAIIQRNPEVVLVDELAHTNVPGARHAKRWQDVSEILDNGIDVYTTLNVQHIESLKDRVEGITDISVRETVPDMMIERSADIQLIDLGPDELLERLKDGKVYLGEQSQIAVLHFFQKDRLTALRELVLRYAAEKVDRDLRVMAVPAERIKGWRPREKLLVAVSHSPHSQKLIRAARRLAFTLNAPWIAVHVDNGTNLSQEDNNRLEKNLAVARDLGAEVITTHDPDISSGIERIARQRGVTQILVGRPPSHPLLRVFYLDTMLDRLARECSDIDVHVIRQEKTVTTHRNKLIAIPTSIPYYSYLLVLLCVVVLTGINWLLLPYIGYKVAGVVFLMGILFLSLFFKKGPIFFASILYALSWMVLFIPPFGAFRPTNFEDAALVVLYFVTAMATGVLVGRAREHKEMLIKREETTQALYDIMRQIAGFPFNVVNFVSLQDRLGKILNGSVEIIIKVINDGLNFDVPYSLMKDEKENAAALWVFEHGKEAGWSTDTLPSSQNLYVPLKGFHETVGVLAYKPTIPRTLTTEEKNFLYTVCQQLATHVERSFVDERIKHASQVKQIEKIHRTILDRIAKEFESPLKSTQDAVNALKTQLIPQKSGNVTKEIQEIENASGSLMKILSNITAMAHLSEGLIPINKSMNSIHEVVWECVENLKKALVSHTIDLKLPDNLPLVSFDFYLIQMLLYNLICNAIENTPEHTTITIETKKNHGFLMLSVSDEGPGISEEQLSVIFDKFYRSPSASGPGIGLGLAIAKTIAELHDGTLKVENLPEKGARFTLYLPIDQDKNEQNLQDAKINDSEKRT